MINSEEKERVNGTMQDYDLRLDFADGTYSIYGISAATIEDAHWKARYDAINVYGDAPEFISTLGIRDAPTLGPLVVIA